MGSLLVSTLPYALAAALAAPVVIVMTAVILSTAERPVRSAFLFVLGAVLLDVVFAVAFLLLAKAAGLDSTSGNAAAWIDALLGALFLVIGVVALFSKESPEKAAARSRRVDALATAGAGTLLLGGVAVQVINVDALAVFAGGLKEIAVADPAPGLGAVVVVVAVLMIVMLAPYHLPLDAWLVSPGWAGGAMKAMSAWFVEHSRALEVVVGIGIGAAFLWKGIAALVS
jgi:threonine/homoserine/homoserine lactone efflux protein